MYYKQFRKIAILVLMFETIGMVSAQADFKIGENVDLINKSAALEVASTKKGYLPPRMTKVQRDAIVSPPVGLMVWCKDCNKATNPPSGELSVFSGVGWPSFTINTLSKLTTGKKADSNAPVLLSPTAITIKGVLISTFGVAPTETGVVWKEIASNDFGTIPVLEDSGSATAPVYKTMGTLVNTAGSTIAVNIHGLTATRPYYFRTYAISASGIGYGNPVIFNLMPPVISTPVVTNGSSFTPTFAGSISVNAGTPKGTITEYGYCSGITNTPTTANNKVMLSTTASLANFNAILNLETFTADPVIDLAVNNYNVVTTGGTYLRYYVIANGTTIYSPPVFFSPGVDLVTGGTAIATVSGIDVISAPLKIGMTSSSTITVHFNVTKAGTYDSFIPESPTGNTTGLTLSTVNGGSFALGAQNLVFSVAGTPGTSLDGNSFVVPRIGTFSTGAIQPATVNNANAICDGMVATTVSALTSKTGKIWMDRNLGASRVALTSDDYQSYGCLYQWGRGNDGHASIVWSSATAGTAVKGTSTSLSATDMPGNNLFIISSNGTYDWRSSTNNTLWQGLNGTNNPCPTTYRLPTKTEFDEEFKSVTGYNITDAATAFASPHKFVLAGNRFNGDATLGSTGSNAYLWSSTVLGTDASYRTFDSSSTDTDYAGRALGFSIRCIKD